MRYLVAAVLCFGLSFCIFALAEDVKKPEPTEIEKLRTENAQLKAQVSAGQTKLGIMAQSVNFCFDQIDHLSAKQ